MTPRERDPQVWAAAYSAAYMRVFEGLFESTDGTSEERTAAVFRRLAEGVHELTELADAAVMALHPGGTYTAPDGTVLREPVDEGPRSYPGV